MFSRTPSPAKASASSTLKLPASSTCPLVFLIQTARSDGQIEVAQVVALETWGAYEERGVTRLNIAEAVMAARVRCRHLRCTGFLIANRHASAWNDRSGGILHDSLQAAKHASGTQRTGGAATHVSAQSARRNRFSHLQRRLVRLRCQHH